VQEKAACEKRRRRLNLFESSEKQLVFMLAPPQAKPAEFSQMIPFDDFFAETPTARIFAPKHHS